MSILRSLLMLVVVVAMAAAGALFALQNEATVPLDVLVYTFAPRSVALWVLAAFALGGIAGLLMASLLVLRLRFGPSAPGTDLAARCCLQGRVAQEGVRVAPHDLLVRQ